MNATELQDLIAQHRGSEQVYFSPVNKGFNYTEGMRAVFQNAGGGAHWLLNTLALQPAILKGVKEHQFTVCLLSVANEKAVLTVSVDLDTTESTDGSIESYKPIDVFYTENIDYTDFPEGNWRFYLVHTTVGTSNVVLAMLPGEY